MTRRTSPFAALLAIALGACASAHDDAPSAAFRPLQRGDTVAVYAARTIDGDTVRVGPGTTRSPTLVNVWATWCASCREEFGDLDRIARTHAAAGLRVVAVSVDEGGTTRVARFARSRRASFLVAHDPEGRVERAFSVVAVPSTFLIAPDGRVLWSHVGALGRGEPLDAALRTALAAPSR